MGVLSLGTMFFSDSLHGYVMIKMHEFRRDALSHTILFYLVPLTQHDKNNCRLTSSSVFWSRYYMLEPKYTS